MRPLTYVAAAFISGIVLSGRVALPVRLLLVLLAISFALLVVLRLFRVRFRHVCLVPVFFLLGAVFIVPYLRPVLPPGHISGFIDTQATGGGAVSLGMDVEGVVAGAPELRRARTRLYVDAELVHTPEGAFETSGRVMLTVLEALPTLRAGDRVRFLAPLSRPWNYGNPGEFDYRSWLMVRGVHATAFIKSPRFLMRAEGADSNAPGGPGGAGGDTRWVAATGAERGGPVGISRMREAMRRLIDSSGARNAGALKALITGDKHAVEPALAEAFRATGTSHLMAISGLHVGMVAFFSYWAFLTLARRSERLLLMVDARKAALLLSLFPVVFYGMLSGFPLSTQRAVVMVAAFVICFAIGRGRELYNTLALAAMVILVVAPYSVWDVSFQLSFAAVFSIIFITRRAERLFEREPGADADDVVSRLTRRSRLWTVSSRLLRGLRPAMVVTIAAGAGTAPLIAMHFNTVSTLSLPANLVAVPATTVVVALLFLSACVLPVFEPASTVLVTAAGLVFELVSMVVRAISHVPYSTVRVATPTVAGVAIFYAALFSGVSFAEGRRYRIAAAVAIISLAGLWGYGHLSSAKVFARGPGELVVTFLSVGQGDSAFVEFPEGRTMLIDGGGLYGDDFDVGERLIAPFLWSKRVGTIDYMVMTHAQRDHMGGLAFIAENFDVGEFWYNGDWRMPLAVPGGARAADQKREGPARLAAAFERARVKMKVVGASTPAVMIDGVRVELLHPDLRKDGGGAGDGLGVNDRSLVVRLTYGLRSVLFTGDIGEQAELLLSGARLSADVLKSPHHGSRYSSSAGFLAKVRPSVVVISNGRGNTFGFPHAETLDRYAGSGARVLRTDLDGAVIVRTDGTRLDLSTYLTGRAR